MKDVSERVDDIVERMRPMVDLWLSEPAKRTENARRQEILCRLYEIGGDHDLHSPWMCAERLGYMVMREQVHLRSMATFATDGRSRDPRTVLRWHINQIDRGRAMQNDNAFRGDGLYDPIVAGWLSLHGRGSAYVQKRLDDEHDYGRQSHVIVNTDIREHFHGVLEMHVVRNEVRAVATLGPGITWKRGYVVFNRLDLPETIIQSLKGRQLDDLLHHPFTTGKGLIIRSMTRSTTGKITLATTGDAVAPLQGETPVAFR